MYICMYVYVHMYVCICTYMQINMYLPQGRVYVCLYLIKDCFCIRDQKPNTKHMYICISFKFVNHTCITYLCTYICMHVHPCKRRQFRSTYFTYIRKYVYKYVIHAYVCTRVSMYIWYVCTYIRTYVWLFQIMFMFIVWWCKLQNQTTSCWVDLDNNLTLTLTNIHIYMKTYIQT